MSVTERLISMDEGVSKSFRTESITK